MARILDFIVGHKQIQETFLRSLSVEKIPSTLLFIGPQGVGKKTLALGLAQSLICEKDKTACGQCGPCLRVEKKQSEALLLLEPEKNQIKIEQAKSILDFLSLSAISRSRVVIIDGAETLNPQAANTLLKILEEPPPNCYFILLAPSSRHVLTTLRSRSMIVRFSPLTLAEMKQKSSAPEWVLRAAQGSLARAHQLSSPEEKTLREDAQRFLEWWLEKRSAYLTPEWREMVRDRQDAIQLARAIGLFYRDAVCWLAGERQDIINIDKLDFIQRLAEANPENLLSSAWQSLGLNTSLLQQRDPSLVYEEFWLRTSHAL